jgi:hypothetical protein
VMTDFQRKPIRPVDSIAECVIQVGVRAGKGLVARARNQHYLQLWGPAA